MIAKYFHSVSQFLNVARFVRKTTIDEEAEKCIKRGFDARCLKKFMYTGRGGTFLSISLKLKIGYDLIQPMLDVPFPAALFFDIVEEEEFICHYQDSPLSGNIENDIIGVDDHAVCFKRIEN